MGLSILGRAQEYEPLEEEKPAKAPEPAKPAVPAEGPSEFDNLQVTTQGVSTVHLRNGAILRGTVAEAGGNVQVKTSRGTFAIPRADVIEVEQGKPGPFYEITLRDGSVLRGSVLQVGGGMATVKTSFGTMKVKRNEVSTVKEIEPPAPAPPSPAPARDVESFEQPEAPQPITLPPKRQIPAPGRGAEKPVSYGQGHRVAAGPSQPKAPQMGGRCGLGLNTTAFSIRYYTQTSLPLKASWGRLW